MNKQELVGIYYNDEFKLEISENFVQLNTNTDTEHKPFYTELICYEKFELQIESSKIKLSESLSITTPKDLHNKIMLILTTDRIIFINLRRFK